MVGLKISSPRKLHFPHQKMTKCKKERMTKTFSLKSKEKKQSSIASSRKAKSALKTCKKKKMRRLRNKMMTKGLR